MSETWLDELEARLASVRCSYVGRCNSGRCPLHGGEARALRKLLRVARAAEALIRADAAVDAAHAAQSRANIKSALLGFGEAHRALRAALRGEETT